MNLIKKKRKRKKERNKQVMIVGKNRPRKSDEQCDRRLSQQIGLRTADIVYVTNDATQI